MPGEGESASSRPGQNAPNTIQTELYHTNQSNADTTGEPGFGQWLRSLLGLKEPEGSFKEALQEVLEEHANDLVNLPAEERRIFSNLLDFGELIVSEIMTPQPDIIAIDINADLQELKQLLVKERHTRLPVYDETIDHVQGFIHVKDLIPFLGTNVEGFAVRDIVREILFVPLGMKVIDLLLKMRIAGVHIAIVVDEYGGTKGMVTLEDLFEEIVGDIQDEHDDEEITELSWDSHGSIIIDAKVRVEELEEQLGLNLNCDAEDDDFDTIGGLVFSNLGRVPTRGDEMTHPAGLHIEILDVDARRIKKVRLTKTANGHSVLAEHATG